MGARVLVVYESMFGNTEQVARVLADAIAEHAPVEVRDVAHAPATLPDDVGLLVVGGPTHAFSMTRSSTRQSAVDQGADPEAATTGIREWLARLGPGTHRPAIATFDTRVTRVRRLPGSAARAAAKVARRAGLEVVTRPRSFYVTDVEGPLVAGELDRAAAWAAELSGVLASTTAGRTGTRNPKG